MIFFVFKKNTDHTSFLEVLNSLHPNLEFTVDVGTNKLPFLDVQVELTENGFNSWVYRKPTHTNVMLNFLSNAPIQWKCGLIICLLKRAYSICSSIYYFEKEIELLRKMFSWNGYPVTFFDGMLGRFMATIENNASAGVQSSTSEVSGEPDTRYVVFKMPYLGGPSRVFAKKLATMVEDCLGVRVRVVYTSLKVQSFFRLKSATPHRLLSRVVYKFDCVSDPEVSYVGQTHRHIEDRMGEHLKDDGDSSGVGAHLQSCSSCATANLGLDNFHVIRKCRSDFDTKIVEAFCIQRLQPTLNKQLYRMGACYRLKVFK